MELNNRDIELINTIFKVCEYKLWNTKEGDKKAEEIIDNWQNKKENYGMMAMGRDLLKRLNGKDNKELEEWKKILN